MELKFMTEPSLNPALMTCPHCGEEEHIWIHSQKERRFFGSHYPAWLFVLVVALLAGGCPIPALVFAFGLDKRTVLAWQLKAGRHAQWVQGELVCQGTLDLGQVQADELYVKTQFGAVWMATAMSVFPRLFIWGEVSVQRSTSLAGRVVAWVRLAGRRGQPIVWLTDDFGGWVEAVRQEFRDPLYTG